MADVLLIKCWQRGHTDHAKIPPLGVMSLAAVLREHGHSVRIMHIGADGGQLIDNALETRKPDVIGISACVYEYRVFKWLTGYLDGAVPDIPVIAGGPLAWSNPISTMRNPGVRAVALGEGERTILDLVDTLMNGGDLASVPGAAVLRDENLVRGPDRPYMTPEELDALPFPAWDLVDLRDHFKYRGMASVGMRRYMQIQTSRGCPYRCIYCHGLMGRRYRARTPAIVLKEFNVLREKFDIHEFEIVDDTFNLDRDRMHEILQGLIDFKDPLLRIQFPNGIRSDLLKDEDIKMLRRAGCDFMSFAFETASPRLQKMIKKHLDIPKAVHAVDVAVNEGIFCNGFFMLGFPSETLEECRATIDLACSTRLHEALFFEVSPFKGTELFNVAMQKSSVDPAKISLDDLDYFTVEHNLAKMNDREFAKLYSSAYLRFYLNPKRILRILARHPRTIQKILHAPRIFCQTVVSIWINARVGRAARKS